MLCCAFGLMAVGCGSTPAVTTTVVSVSEKTVTADPPDPNADDAIDGAQLERKFTKTFNAERRDGLTISGVVCVPSPLFDGDTTRWDCVGDLSDGTSKTWEFKVNQADGSWSAESKSD